MTTKKRDWSKINRKRPILLSLRVTKEERQLIDEVTQLVNKSVTDTILELCKQYKKEVTSHEEI